MKDCKEYKQYWQIYIILSTKTIEVCITYTLYFVNLLACMNIVKPSFTVWPSCNFQVRCRAVSPNVSTQSRHVCVVPKMLRYNVIEWPTNNEQQLATMYHNLPKTRSIPLNPVNTPLYIKVLYHWTGYWNSNSNHYFWKQYIILIVIISL